MYNSEQIFQGNQDSTLFCSFECIYLHICSPTYHCCLKCMYTADLFFLTPHWIFSWFMQKVCGLESTVNLYKDLNVSYIHHTAERQFLHTFPCGNCKEHDHEMCSMSNRHLSTLNFPLITIACLGQEQNSGEEPHSSLVQIIPACLMLTRSFPLPAAVPLTSISINKMIAIVFSKKMLSTLHHLFAYSLCNIHLLLFCLPTHANKLVLCKYLQT